jgi:glycosyltransferase involved in cell wall biosynthesis
MLITVSVITINYNNCDGLKSTIDSVSQQLSSIDEYILVDGNSTDGSINYINTIDSSLFTLKIIEDDDGIYDAINKGIMASSSDYILLAHSGDVLVNDVISRFKNFASESFADIYYGCLFSNDGLSTICPKKNALNKITHSMTLFHTATFIRRTAYIEYGLYNKLFKISGDYELIRRYYLKKVSFYLFPFPVCSMSPGGASDQFKNLHLLVYEYFCAMYDFPFLKRLICTVKYFLKSFLYFIVRYLK